LGESVSEQKNQNLEEIGLLVCGPTEMENDVYSACWFVNHNGPPSQHLTFAFHSHTFLL